jgi:hypothetical protein
MLIAGKIANAKKNVLAKNVKIVKNLTLLKRNINVTASVIKMVKDMCLLMEKKVMFAQTHVRNSFPVPNKTKLPPKRWQFLLA